MTEQNRAMTQDDVRREIAEAKVRWDREAREARRERRWAEERFAHVLTGHVFGALGTFVLCWFACVLLGLAATGGDPGKGMSLFMTVGPFALWLAGAAIYARRAFGPGREGDGGDRA